MEQKINLLYVITKLELGGAQKHLLNLIGRLDKDKFNIFLLTARDGLLMEDALSIDGLTIKRSVWLERLLNPFKDVAALVEIYRFIKKNKIDIVHTHSSKAGLLGRWAARLAKVKIILHTIHGWSFNNYQSRLSRMFFIWLEKITARFTHKIIVVSDSDKQKGLANRIGTNSNYELIRYGIDSSEFCATKESIRQSLAVDRNDLVVGTVACFKPQKSPQDFIKLAFLVSQNMHNVKFVLVGDGILRVNIERLIDSFGLGSKIILTGWRRDVPRILQAIDVFVLTSLWEGLPISVLEAMAAERPVIATNTGGVGEILEEGKTGFLVAPADMETMSERLILLLGDSLLRRTIGQNARQALDNNLTLFDVAKNTQKVYFELNSAMLRYNISGNAH